MKRFIFLTFGFMGWAFYEMSGGADFEPAGQQMARAETGAETETSNLITAAIANAARQMDRRPVFPTRETDAPATTPADDSTEVTRVALNLTTLSDLPRPGDNALVQKAVANSTDTPTVTKAGMIAPNNTGAKVIKASASTGSVPQNAGYSVSSADTPAIIPSLIDPNDSGATTTRVSTSQNDIRTVSGSRVNVRGGPGTDFGVVGKLGEGETVEVIEDNGAGWVRFRTVGGGDEGWMADFLLSNG